MLARNLMFYLFCFISAKAEEMSVPTAAEARADTDRLESIIQTSRKTFIVDLNAAKLSPEERAIRIEQWQKEQAPMLKQAHEARTALLQAGKVTPTPANSITPTTLEIQSDPVLKDIQEIEAEIGDFRRSLGTAKLTPEQRAIQVEQFHQINRPALEQLDLMKLQAARQANPSQGKPGDTAGESTNESTNPSGRAGYLNTELKRVAAQLSKIAPEDRANYLETHSATLSAMGKELSETVAISVTDIDSSSNLEPATTQEPAAKTAP